MSGTKKDSRYHIGYYRDTPADQPVFVASNDVDKGCKLNILADNLFAALHSHVESSEHKGTKKVCSIL